MAEHLMRDDEYRGSIDAKLWRRIVAHTRPYKTPLAGLAVSGLCLAVIETLLPLATARLIDEATGEMRRSVVLGWGGLYVGLIVAFSFIVWLFIIYAGQIATGVARDLRRDGFAKLQELSFSYFDVRPVGWLVSRLTSDCQKLASLIPWFMLDLFWGASVTVCIVVAMLLLHWPLALVVMLIIPPLAVGSWIFQKRLLESSRAVRYTNSLITASFNESIAGARTTKALVREAENLVEFQGLSSSMYDHSIRNALQSAVYLPMVITIGSAGVGLALWRGGLVAGEPGGVSLGSLVAFMQYAAFLYMPIQELSRRFTELQAAQAAAERVQTLLDTEPAIRDSDLVRERLDKHSGPDGPWDGGDTRIERIEFENVLFEYKDGEPVLREFDLRVDAGQTIALVGATGGGKSTIVSLVSRFYEPTSGRVTINGVDYRERSLGWLQAQLGVVLQTPHLFSGSVRENIRYGRLDATQEEIEAAARLARAHDFIVDLEGGYDSEVGEGGSRLSTGQRQLVSLARAVLADPQIFVMDEATSSVDTETEMLIQEAIDAVLKGRIAFVIAHRLSTVRAADRILVIDGGRIVESGDHASLLARRGRYHELYTKQFARDAQA